MPIPARIGRYEFELVLGQGPFGRVLLARDARLKRQVAVKMMRDDLGLTPTEKNALAEGLRRAAHAAAALSHPSIVVLHDTDDDEVVGPFLVSELVQAPTLRERLTRGPLPKIEIAGLARALSAALGHAHGAGVLHGDIKPENVWLAANGPKLGDFGFPLSAQTVPAAARLRTPYVAPEVASSGEASLRGDQFSFAATLFEALTGRPPFGDSADVAGARAGADVTDPKHRGALWELRGNIHLEAIFECALALDPGRRFPSCEAFAVTLAETLEAASIPIPTPPFSQASLVPRSTRRWQNAVAGAAVLVIFTLVALGGQHRTSSEGVSLKSVARAFGASMAPPRSAPEWAPPGTSSKGPPSGALRDAQPTSLTLPSNDP